MNSFNFNEWFDSVQITDDKVKRSLKDKLKENGYNTADALSNMSIIFFENLRLKYGESDALRAALDRINEQTGDIFDLLISWFCCYLFYVVVCLVLFPHHISYFLN